MDGSATHGESAVAAKCNGMKEVENEAAIARDGWVLRTLAERVKGWVCGKVAGVGYEHGLPVRPVRWAVLAL